jgi:SP family general alpha glucoside:H+ symporter-like MFS transporter
MGDQIDSKAYGADTHIEKAMSTVDLDEKSTAAQNKAAAIEAENAEHNMGVPQAVKEYPMAALWAFVMSCTIVSRHFVLPSPNRNNGS